MALRAAPFFSIRSAARRTAPEFSHSVRRRFTPLQYFSVALCSGPILSYKLYFFFKLAPLRLRRSNTFASTFLQHSSTVYFPTTLFDASRRYYTFTPLFATLRAALIFSHAPPRPQISLRPLLGREIPPGVSYTVHPVNFTPDSC